MTQQRKAIIFSCILFTFILGFEFWNYLTSEKMDTILEIIENSDSTKIESIVIAPYNLKYPGNLTRDTIIIKDKIKIDNLLKSFKGLAYNHPTRGIHRIWNCYLDINLAKSFKNNLKDKSKIELLVFDTSDGLFIEFFNVFGYQTYSNKKLKYKLEEITNYQFIFDKNE